MPDSPVCGCVHIAEELRVCHGPDARLEQRQHCFHLQAAGLQSATKFWQHSDMLDQRPAAKPEQCLIGTHPAAGASGEDKPGSLRHERILTSPLVRDGRRRGIDIRNIMLYICLVASWGIVTSLTAHAAPVVE